MDGSQKYKKESEVAKKVHYFLRLASTVYLKGILPELR